MFIRNGRKRKVGKIKLNTVVTNDIRFGDYILFQEYKRLDYDGKQYDYTRSTPRLAIFLGWFVADQTIGFEYTCWRNDMRQWEFSTIEHHIDWSDHTDLLAHWKYKPTWKEILPAMRKAKVACQVKNEEVFEKDGK